MKIKGLIASVVLCGVSLLALFLGFYRNQWRVVDQKWFLNYQHDTESLILGRLVQSRDAGILSYAGLAGWGTAGGMPSGRPARRFVTPSGKRALFQYTAYQDGLAFSVYHPYRSQIGGQGMVLGLLDRAVDVSPQRKLDYFYVLVSFFSALVLTAVVFWFYREMGASVSLGVLGSMIFSQWLVVFGKNLWWWLGVFYLPMVSCMYFLRKAQQEGRRAVFLACIVFFSVLVKCFLNGYEYITTTLVMMLTPFVYYAVLEKWGIRVFIQRTCLAAASAVLAIGLSLGLLLWQASFLGGGRRGAWEHIVFSLKRRTTGVFQDPPDFSVGSVVWTYLNSSFLDFKGDLWLGLQGLHVYYFQIILLFALGSFLVLWPRLRYPGGEGYHAVALVAATWFSILAPLSWYVVFKQHSYWHGHINSVLWQMPFTIFGFALLGLLFRNLFCQAWRRCICKVVGKP